MVAIDQAADGLEAVYLVNNTVKQKTRPYDAVFLDCLMPVMDGPSAALAMRKMGYAGEAATNRTPLSPFSSFHFSMLILPSFLPPSLYVRTYVYMYACISVCISICLCTFLSMRVLP